MSEHERIASSLPGNDELCLVGIAVRVDDRDHGQVQALCLAHGERLLLEVDDEDRVGLALHVGDATQVGLELLELGLHRDALLRRQQGQLAIVLQPAEIVQVRDPILDRAPVREEPAEPAVRDERHPDACCLGANCVLGLLLRADEQDRATAFSDVARKVVRFLDELLRLLQVDDVDAAALREDEALHLRVPATCLVAEVNSSLQQLLHGDNCQRDQPLSMWFSEVVLRRALTEPDSDRGATAPPP